MRPKTTKSGKANLKRETIRKLTASPLSDAQLAQVAGGTCYPKTSCTCTN